eukprot:CAMPEP_0119124898 /NCGR_PEP_ID=MMETSP1310-20130426/4365_1 /TAXON_ID=464262 /ORGANISM="Genus nov. species nov., Strain RCC2339" /LENGTH=90 /DNA_ID=CAMNT_0007114911 /DNA_START=335 /DNA_END=607 /DNA_ORIENTATION=+
MLHARGEVVEKAPAAKLRVQRQVIRKVRFGDAVHLRWRLHVRIDRGVRSRVPMQLLKTLAQDGAHERDAFFIALCAAEDQRGITAMQQPG